MIYILGFTIFILLALMLVMQLFYQKQRRLHLDKISKLNKAILILEAANLRQRSSVELSIEMKSILDNARSQIDQKLLEIISDQAKS